MARDFLSRWFLPLLLLLTALRILLGSQLELAPDEAYYYQWSQRLDWAYYSKGPGVALAVRIGTALFGPTELGVRAMSPFLALGTSLIAFALARRLYGASVAVWTVMTINVAPIFQAGSVVMTIDGLSIFFWAAALWSFWLALEHSQGADRWNARAIAASGFWYWPLTGLLLAFGFLSKYTNALELLSIVLVLASTARFRVEFRRPGFWTMVAVLLLGALPTLIWNAHHDWITLEHLWSRGDLNTPFRFHPFAIFAYLAVHFGVYSPLIFAAMLAALYRGCRDAATHFKSRFLVAFALPLLGIYVLWSIKKCGEGNWTAPAVWSLTILTVAFWHRLVSGAIENQWLKAANARTRNLPAPWSRISGALLSIFEPVRYAAVALAVGLLLSLLIVNTDAIRRTGVRLGYRKDPTGRMRGWKTMAIAVDDLRHRLEKQSGKPLFLIAEKYQIASCLAFYLPEKRADGPGHPPVYIPESQAFENQYSFWPRYDEMVGVVDLARSLLAKATDPAQRKALAGAVAAAGDPRVAADSPEAAERRRALIRAMLAVSPALPLDEYASQEMGVSLFHGRDALYISDYEFEQPPTSIVGAFEKVELVANWVETRRGLRLRTIRIFACHNYHSLPL